MAYSTRGAQPRRVASTDITPNTEIPSNSGFAPPFPSFPAHVPADLPSDTSVLSYASVPDSIVGPNIPSLGANTGVHAHGPTSGPGNEDRSWEATLEQTRKLLGLGGKRYGRHVESFEDHERFKKARKQLLRKKLEDRSGDMPQDPAGQQALIQRLYNAMSNLDGIETSTTRKYSLRNGGTHFIDSIGVKCVKDMNEFEMEMLAWDFLVAVRDAQSGHLELPAKYRFETYYTFMDRFHGLESCLRANKHLIRSALQSNEWMARIAANPRGERSKKKANDKTNTLKLDQLAAARQQLKKDGAAALGTKRQASTDTLPEKRPRLSTDSDVSMQGQAHPGLLEQTQLLQQQSQLPHDQVAIHLHYGGPENHGYSEQFGNPQQVAGPRPSENHLQIENREYLARPQHYDGIPQQQGDNQVPEIPAHHENPQQSQTPQQPQQGDKPESLEHPQQHGRPQHQDQRHEGDGNTNQAVPTAQTISDEDLEEIEAFMDKYPFTDWEDTLEGNDF
ncbi:hypothetical protein F5883DRAFT_646306 [Diaporthe sp. PMI_573]|nr:hypothetical protein F5883DRAFT_646306 [Diaporthaceae sp. PMI_573]